MCKTSTGLLLFVCALGLGGCKESQAARSCGGRIEIKTMGDIGALRDCNAIDGDLWIVESNLSSLEGLEHVKSVRYLVIGGNRELSSLRGLELQEVSGVTLWNNPPLSDISALEAAPRVRALVVLQGNGIAPEALPQRHSNVTLVER